MRTLLLVAAVIALTSVSVAQARTHHKHHHARHHYAYHHKGHYHRLGQGELRQAQNVQPWAQSQVNSARPSDCYGIKWCGCYLRHLLGIPNKALNLARNWLYVGSPTSAHAGVVAVWPHHVGLVKDVRPGQILLLSGNDGHAVRERWRSSRGVIGYRQVGGGFSAVSTFSLASNY